MSLNDYLSKLKVKLNGHKNTVTGIRVVSKDGAKYLQIGLKDSVTDYCQCIEFEVSGLVKVSSYFIQMPEQAKSFLDDVAEAGKGFASRFERAINAFNSTDNKENK